MNQSKIQNVLVTGAGGFIGSHLVDACVEAGWKVKALIHYNSRSGFGWLENSRYIDEVEICSGDIRDYDSVFSACQNCDTVFHLAALIGIPYSYVSPQAYIKTNIEGTYNILQSCRVLKTNNILVTSTSETYGSAQYVPIDEKHPFVGQSPYAASKIAADQLAISYHRSFELPVKIARPFNTYGPRQSARAIIPTIITQILAGKRSLSLGNLTPTRDLTFVKDTVSAFIALARHQGLWGEASNIGFGKEISVGDIARLIATLMNVDVVIDSSKERQRSENSEVDRLLSNSGKFRLATGWLPRYSLDTGLLETVDFLLSNMDIYKPDQYAI